LRAPIGFDAIRKGDGCLTPAEAISLLHARIETKG